MMTTRHFAGSSLCCLLFAACASAQDGLLTAELSDASPRVRSNAPITVLWKVFWNGSSIREGHFEMMLSDGQRTICHSRSHDVVLSPGEQTIRLGLPTAGSFVSWNQDQVELKFVAKDHIHDLGKFPLLGRAGGRSLSICVCGPRFGQLDPTEDQVIRSLRFGALLEDGQNLVSTVNTYWESDDMPSGPLYHCNFDIVVLTEQGLAELRKSQLDALLKWARAGGSVCVFPGALLETRHIDFLNDLFATAPSPPFLLDAAGKFSGDDQQKHDGMWLARCELGRAVVVDREAFAAVANSREATRQLGCFLWKIKHERVDYLVHKPPPDPRGLQNPGPWYGQQMASQPIEGLGQFLERLMPAEVKIVPSSLIAAVLFGYLLLIGPGDYLLLGRFGLRRYTWLTFPLATVLVAVLCVKVSETYLSSTNTGETLAVRDVDGQGNVLRESQFQLIFMGTRTKVTHEVANAIFTPLDQQRLALSDVYAYQYSGYTGLRQGQDTVQEYAGLMPLRYEVRQSISQWMPQVNRKFTIAPESRVDFPWDKVALAETSQGRDELRDLILKKWPNAKATVLNGQNNYRLCGAGVFPPIHRRPDGGRPYQRQQFAGNAFLMGLCRRTDNGFFNLISQLSPNGGDNFEDLALLDVSDNKQWLLVIAVEEDDQLVLYRRLHRKTDQ